MASRATCPCCRQKWPEGKDPADVADGLMSLRLSDLVTGIANNNSTLSPIFNEPTLGEEIAGIVAYRALAISDAEELLEEALRAVRSAGEKFASCPAVASLPAFLARVGKPGDGLDGKYLDVGGVRISWEGGVLSFKDAAERREEDEGCLSTLL